MRKSILLALAGVAFAAACWPTRPNPRYCSETDPCIEPGTFCETDTNTCIPIGDASVDLPPPDQALMCHEDLGCAMAGKPICDDTSHTCRACQTNECGGTLHCDTTSGACVACLVEADCSATRGICSSDHNCVACKGNSDCASGLCDDGKCAVESDVAYVDSDTTKCTGGDGTRTKPYCEIVDAVAGTKPYVLVAGHDSAPYKALTLATARTVTIVGPGRSASAQATILETGKAAILVNPASGAVNLVVAGLELIGGSAPSQAGVHCVPVGGTAAVVIRDSNIHNSPVAGVDAAGCMTTVTNNLIKMNAGVGITTTGGKATIDRNTITGNSGGGVQIQGTNPFTIENNFIVNNLSTAGPGLSLDAASNGTIRYNTIANNTLSGGKGGVDCGLAGSKTIESSIVVGNSAPTGTQFGSQCVISSVGRVVTGTDSIVGATQLTPTFTSDFHLVSGNANVACCVDKGVDGPMLDIDGEMRPKGNGPDIGADEVQ